MNTLFGILKNILSVHTTVFEQRLNEKKKKKMESARVFDSTLFNFNI